MLSGTLPCRTPLGQIRMIARRRRSLTRGAVSELPDGWREQGDKVVYVLTGPTAGKPPGTGAVQKYWNRGLPLISSGHRVSFLPVSVPRSRCVGVLGLRIVVQDVAASLGLAVAAAAVPLEFDVAASLWPAVAAAAHSERAPARDLSSPLATQSQTPSR